MQDLKKAAAGIAAAFGVDVSSACKIVGYYNAGTHKDLETVSALVAGDLSAVPAAAAALGVSLQGVNTAKKDQEKKTENKNAVQRSENKKRKEKKTTAARDDLMQEKEKKTAAHDMRIVKSTPAGGDIEKITGDIIPAGVSGPDMLPESLPDDVEQWLLDWSAKYNIDLEKCAGLQWRAACIYIGQQIQKSGILLDSEKMRVKGIKIYNPVAVAALLPLWEYFTNVYKHVPLASDFIAFTGVSREYFYDTRGILSSSYVDLAKKARAIEESGLSAGLVDGRENPTGRIFYSKARLGWRESVEIVHTSAAAVVSSDDLPDLSGKIELLPGGNN